jgi:hypothetical protein
MTQLIDCTKIDISKLMIIVDYNDHFAVETTGGLGNE